ncbi:MAG: histidine phosphatase family protein [Candidatus Saccharibacteria bacterium]|nr:histidine phosphatase family protein [Candidatus Saccharibacteria bacterium]
MIHTTLYFVRHGQTDANIVAAQSNEAYDSNMPLNRVGAGQATAVARELEKLTPVAIITSPLLRARQTAKQIAMYHPIVPLIEMTYLAERSIGTVANRSWHRLFDVDENIQPEGGESVRDFLTRIY